MNLIKTSNDCDSTDVSDSFGQNAFRRLSLHEQYVKTLLEVTRNLNRMIFYFIEHFFR